MFVICTIVAGMETVVFTIQIMFTVPTSLSLASPFLGPKTSPSYLVLITFIV